MLKLIFPDGRREGVWLVEPRIRIGSHNSNDILLEGEQVSPFHAEIHVRPDGVFIVDMHSKSGVKVNDQKIEKAVRLKENTRVDIGGHILAITKPAEERARPRKQDGAEWGIKSNASWLPQNYYALDGTVTIGRDPECDITIPVSHLSRRHCQLTVAGAHLLIKDLGSTNGTFLNGEQIAEGRAKPGDKIRFDVITFEVVGPKLDDDRTIVRPQSAPKPRTAAKPASAAKGKPRAAAATSKPTASPSKSASAAQPKSNSGPKTIPIQDVGAKRKRNWLLAAGAFVLAFAALAGWYLTQQG
ncbi:MAG: FHA domain-containing protein [Gammaproteobacteria bacterium]|nr:MAG: FHA domain-containing protein [Gammaproteobacteria bacterium]